jgi:hypothetical protein
MVYYTLAGLRRNHKAIILEIIMNADQKPAVIGRAEKVDLPDFGFSGVPAKIDTGADSSAIWVSRAEEKNGSLHCVFFGPGSQFYSGEAVIISKGYQITRVANSFGQKELRYKLKLRIRVKGRLVKATFTLSDRSLKTYPILLGRRLLRGKFLVDVTDGEALTAAERARTRLLKKELSNLKRGKE